MAHATKLFISNLDCRVCDSDISELFSEFGGIREATVHYNQWGYSLGTAHVVFVRSRDASVALRNYQGVPLDGRPMVITAFSQPSYDNSTSKLPAKMRLASGPHRSFKGLKRLSRGMKGPFAMHRSRSDEGYASDKVKFFKPSQVVKDRKGKNSKTTSKCSSLSEADLDAELEEYCEKRKCSRAAEESSDNSMEVLSMTEDFGYLELSLESVSESSNNLDEPMSEAVALDPQAKVKSPNALNVEKYPSKLKVTEKKRSSLETVKESQCEVESEVKLFKTKTRLPSLPGIAEKSEENEPSYGDCTKDTDDLNLVLDDSADEASELQESLALEASKIRDAVPKGVLEEMEGINVVEGIAVPEDDLVEPESTSEKLKSLKITEETSIPEAPSVECISSTVEFVNSNEEGVNDEMDELKSEEIECVEFTSKISPESIASEVKLPFTDDSRMTTDVSEICQNPKDQCGNLDNLKDGETESDNEMEIQNISVDVTETPGALKRIPEENESENTNEDSSRTSGQARDNSNRTKEISNDLTVAEMVTNADTSVAADCRSEDATVTSGDGGEDTTPTSEDRSKDASVTSENGSENTTATSGEGSKDTTVTSGDGIKDTSVTKEDESKDTTVTSDESKDTTVTLEDESKDRTVTSGDGSKDAPITSGDKSEDIITALEDTSRESMKTPGDKCEDSPITSEVISKDSTLTSEDACQPMETGASSVKKVTPPNKTPLKKVTPPNKVTKSKREYNPRRSTRLTPMKKQK